MRGLKFSRSTGEGPKAGARREVQSERFAAYFPRLFAYACAATSDDEAAREVVVSAFSDAFSRADIREDEFEIDLFRTARAICQSSEYRARRHNDGLTPREREVISLLFDAQLDRAQIGLLLGVRDEVVATALVRGLRKLRTSFASSGAGAAVPSFS
jgi:DNA-directed RNA polymerase specialized sigma24 family protein